MKPIRKKILLATALLAAMLFTLPNQTTQVLSQGQMGTVTQTIVSTTGTMLPLSGECRWLWWSMIIAPGTSELRGNIGPPSIPPVFFFLMNQQQEALFLGDECNGGSYAAIFSYEFINATSSYQFDWKNPAAGQYFLIFDNEGAVASQILIPFTLVGVFNAEQSMTTVTTNIVLTTYQSTTTVTYYMNTTTVTST